MSLRSGLGGKGQRPGQLTKDDMRKLVQLAGEQAGFEVKPEVPALTGRMDFGWFEKATLIWIVAWEIDGRNVAPNHIEGDEGRLGNAKKFAACGAALKVQALYTVRGRILGSAGIATCRRCLAQDVRVIVDEDLMKPGGIEAIMEEARKLAGFSQLT